MCDHFSILLSESHDHDQEEVEIDSYEEEAPSCYDGCFGLFKFPWKQSSSKNEGKYILGGGNTTTKEVIWWGKKLSNARDFTEVYGGAKWKNSVRKIGAYCRGCRKQKLGLCKNKKPQNRFQYDINSYNLNFDNGIDGRDGDYRAVDFSARFAVPASFISQQGRTVDIHTSVESSRLEKN